MFLDDLGNMKYLIFVRGDNTPLKKRVVREIIAGLNPDINTVRGIRVSMNDYGPFRDKGERKAGARSARNLTKKVLGTSHQESFIVIDNPNERPQDWSSYFTLADAIRVEVLGIGIDVCENEQMPEDDQKNEQGRNRTLFQASMYKYACVKNEQDINPVIEMIVSSEKGENNVR